MSSFTPIDQDLHRWSVQNKIHVATEYKDCDVRSVEIATRSGSVQVWVERQANGRFEVIGCNNLVDTNIGPALDDLLARIHQWTW